MNGSIHRSLANLSDEFLRITWAFYPHTASCLGLHAYDGRAPDLSRSALEIRAADLHRFLAALDQIDPDDLDDGAWLDHQVLRHQAAFEAFVIEDWQKWACDPFYYLEPLDVSNYVLRSYAPLAQRVEALISHLTGFPAILDAMRENLTQVAAPVLTTSLRLMKGMSVFLAVDLPQAVAGLEDASLQARFEEANREAVDMIDGTIDWMEDDLAPRATAGYALGPERFARMLRWSEAVDVPLDRLREVADADLRRNKAAYLKTAAAIAPGKDPLQVTAEGLGDHPAPEDLVAETRRIVDGLRQHVIDHEVVSVPADEDCVVAETPSFLRYAFAMMDPPGPFERVAREAYYYVTPPKAGWTAEKTEEWMTQFAYHILRGISVHEAWPGHYLHALHMRNAPSKVTQAFGAYAFYEAWAHYCEEMMLEIGWRADDPWARLGQLGEALVRNVRFVCALGLHTEGMTVAEAKERFVEDAFMAPATAAEEALRGTGDPQYLNYTLGKLMLRKLRADVEARDGEDFDLRSFHDRLLSYGAPPLPLVRELILGRGDREIL
jgi:uncharacterized protein (DUF885 family)